MGARLRELTGARAARERADWPSAQAGYEAGISAGPSGEAYEGLAAALFWQNQVDGTFRAMERAYVLFRQAGEPGRAAWAALWLAGQYMRVKGNPAAARGWAARSGRLT